MSSVLRAMNRKSKLPDRIKNGAAKVLIAIPGDLFENMNIYTAMFCCQLASRGIADLQAVPGRDPTRARNTFIKDFLFNKQMAEYTHLFFLDADTTPHNDFIVDKFLAMRKPVVCGVTPVYMKNEHEYRWPILTWGDSLISELDILWKEKRKRFTEDLKARFQGKELARTPEEEKASEELLEKIYQLELKAKPIPCGKLPSETFKAFRVGGTTMLIKRCVLEAIIPPWQFTVAKGNGQTVLSEDYWFSDRIREAGFEIIVDPTEWCRHANMNAIDEIAMADNTGLIEDAKRTGNTRLWQKTG